METQICGQPLIPAIVFDKADETVESFEIGYEVGYDFENFQKYVSNRYINSSIFCNLVVL